MVDVSLVEITAKKKRQEPAETNLRIFSDMFSTQQRYSYSYLMTSSREDMLSVEATDVSEKVSKCNYEAETPYTVIFLYDFFNDTESQDFVSLYGGKLHNISSSNITILTFFSSKMAKNWSNVLFRSRIRPAKDDCVTDFRVHLKNLQTRYKIKKLPALVLVKKEEDGTESSCVVNFPGLKKDGLYKAVEQVIFTVYNNCDSDFSLLASKICGPDSEITKNKSLSNMTVFDFIDMLVKKEKKKTNRSYTLEDLAKEIGVSTRTLANRRSECNFTRDECFIVALKFSLDLDDLNFLLRANENQDLGMAGRDGIIRLCLSEERSISETNQRLKAEGYKTLR